MKASAYKLSEPRRLALLNANGKPVYCACAACEKAEPIIAGYIGFGDGATLNVIGNIKTASGFYTGATYCAECWPNVEAVTA